MARNRLWNARTPWNDKNCFKNSPPLKCEHLERESECELSLYLSPSPSFKRCSKQVLSHFGQLCYALQWWRSMRVADLSGLNRTNSLFVILFMWNIHVFSLCTEFLSEPGNSPTGSGSGPEWESVQTSRPLPHHNRVNNLSFVANVYLSPGLSLCKIWFTNAKLSVWSPWITAIFVLLVLLGDPFFEECTFSELWTFYHCTCFLFHKNDPGRRERGKNVCQAEIFLTPLPLCLCLRIHSGLTQLV